MLCAGLYYLFLIVTYFLSIIKFINPVIPFSFIISIPFLRFVRVINLDTNTIHFNPSNVLLYQTHLLLLHNILLKNMYSLPDNGINLLLQDYYECIPFFA